MLNETLKTFTLTSLDGCTALRLNNYQAFLFMKEEVFNKVLERVSELSEITPYKVLRCNQEECVDARYALIAVLSERMNDRQIAEVSGWSIQLVNKARNNFHERCRFRWGLKDMYKELSIFAT